MVHSPASDRTPSSAVLVVEDDPYLRTTLQRLLRDDGFAVVAASDGREGLDRLRAENVAVVMIDLAMPIMDGPAFLEEKARDPGIAGVPTVVVTGRAVVELATTRSVRAVLHKPIEFDRLAQVLRRVATEDLPGAGSHGGTVT
jgi:CheY-like chemotaxis protein